MNNFDTYFNSLIPQVRGMTAKLKALDNIYHTTINPISVYGEIQINLQQNHNLVQLFKSKFNIEINIVCINKESFIKAFIISFGSKKNIYITKNNTCWTRFLVCKELSQILIYNKNNLTQTLLDIENLLSHLINNMHDKNNPQVSADYVAYFAAIEFLMPSNIIDDLLALKKQGFSNNQIAKKMLVPEKIVDYRLSNAGQNLFA